MDKRRQLFSFVAVAAAAVAGLASASAAGSSGTGGRILVVCLAKDPLALQICSLNPNGTGYRQLTRGPERINSTDPEFSPDGRKIVFARGPINGQTSIYVMNADSSDIRQLTHCANCYGEDTPTYSPDGRTIAFHRDPRDARGGIFLVRADGTGIRQLTRQICDCYDGGPSFAPDGQRLVFARFQNTKRNPNGTHRSALFTITLDSGRLTRITAWTTGAAYPEWSPTGKLIVFDSYSNEALRPGISRNLFTVRPDGTGLIAITHASGGTEQDYQPSWSPDGQWIAFTREANAQQTPGVHGDQDTDIMRADGTDIRRIAAGGRGGHSVDWGR